MDQVKIRRALVSVTDKTGVVDFCRSLAEDFGVEIVSTGGTAKALEEGGVKVRAIDDLTGFPEMMDGRVKTLHPKVHGGLLARRDLESHMAQAAEHGIELIDMVVVNLYAFEATIAKEGVTEAEAIENIDIGGPSMLRSAAKNFSAVTVVTKPQTYDDILAEMRENDGATTLETRKALATEVFRTTSHYDNAIWKYLSGYNSTSFPEEVRLRLEKVQDLRYGENPHQAAAFYRFDDAKEHTLGRAEQLQGKELSYNNILDTDACWAAVREFDEPACVIVKHTNPCGVSVNEDITAAYKRAHAADSISAYGGVMAFNRTVPGDPDPGDLRQRPVRRGHDRARLRARGARAARDEEEPARASHRRRPSDGGALRVSRGRGRNARADQRRGCRGPRRLQGGHSATAHARGDGAAALRLEGRQEREEQRDPSREELRDRRCGCGSDEPSRLGADRHREGRREGARRGVRVGRVHAVPRLARGLRRSGRDRGDPAGRLCARRRSIATADLLGVAMVFTGHRHFRH